MSCASSRLTRRTRRGNETTWTAKTGWVRLSFGGGTLLDPTDVALTSDDAYAYVASRGTGNVQIFDALGNYVDAFTVAGLDPTGIALTSDDAFVYVSGGATDSIETFTCDGTHLV